MRRVWRREEVTPLQDKERRVPAYALA
jgi:hypothetical protein